MSGRGLRTGTTDRCDAKSACPKDCPCVTVDGGTKCDCDYKVQCGGKSIVIGNVKKCK